MSMASDMAKGWKRIPRAARWGLAAGGFVAVYLLAIDPALALRDEWVRRAELRTTDIERYREQSDRASAADAKIALAVRRFGDVRVPPVGESGGGAVLGRVDQIMRKHRVADWSMTQQRPIALGRDAMVSALKPGQEVQRIVFNLSVEGGQEAVAGVIADLERTPEITTIGNLAIRRQPGQGGAAAGAGRVSATLNPEVWIIAEKEQPRR
ncbi:MAG: hypothetical protein IBJ11_04950 [Phycisphaerales bacterium]|nr:hypothetical protein [Phycisphaerales bacterium]